MSILTLILIVLLIAAFAGSGPWFGYSRGWGYGPMSIVGVLLLILIVLALTGHLGGLDGRAY